MRKSDKKIENQLRIALTDVCERSLKEIEGFQWLTHLVNYSNFPSSLKVICIFDTNENLSVFMSKGKQIKLISLIQKKLHEMGVNIEDMSEHVAYDTEENCDANNNGKWAERLQQPFSN